MKTLSSASFFRAFDLLLSTSNPGLKQDNWTVDDVHFARERHSFAGSVYRFAIEIYLMSRPGRHGWECMVVKENWWKAGQTEVVKALRWCQRRRGNSKSIIAWLHSQE